MLEHQHWQQHPSPPHLPPQKQRFKALESLKEAGSQCILVATDVAARGIDIPSVASVIHYDLPRSGCVDAFIHRSGRTAVSQVGWGLQIGS